MTTTPAAGRTDGAVPALLADRDFRCYFVARVLSTIGSLTTYIALPVLVFRLSGSAPLTALVSGFEALPYDVVGLFSGALSDRWDRRRVMVYADVISAALVGSVPAAHAAGILTVPHVLLVALLGPGVQVFFDGANAGALPTLVGRDRIAPANAMVSGTQTAFDTLTPSAAGVMLAVLAPAWFLAVDALSFVASALLMARVRRPLHDQQRAREHFTVGVLVSDMAAGLRFVVRHPGVRTMTIVGMVQSIETGGFVALMVVWATRVLQIGDHGWRFGLVFGSFGFGGVLASVALVRLLRRMSAARVCLLALPFSATAGILTELTTTWWLAALGLVAWGTAAMMVLVNSVSYRQQVTPEHLLGRVNTAGRLLSWGGRLDGRCRDRRPGSGPLGRQARDAAGGLHVDARRRSRMDVTAAPGRAASSRGCRDTSRRRTVIS